MNSVITLISLMGLLLSFFFFFLAQEVITLTFGKSFEQSANILKIHIWAVLFLALNAISFSYFTVQDLQKTNLYRGCVAFFVKRRIELFSYTNIRTGRAALSTLLSIFIGIYFFNILSPKLDPFLDADKWSDFRSLEKNIG